MSGSSLNATRSRDERSPQEYPRLCPISLHGSRRDLECFRRLILSQTAEEPTLDDPSETRLDRRESIEGLVQVEYDLGLIITRDLFVVERDALETALPLLGESRPRAIDEHLSHAERGDSEKV